MRSIEYMVDYCIQIPIKNKDAKVAFLLSSQEEYKNFVDYLQNTLLSRLGYSFNKSDSSVKHYGNHLIKVMYITENNKNNFAGFQFTHVFVSENVSIFLYPVIQTLIRGRDTDKFTKAMGLYTPYKSHVILDY